MNVYEDAKRVDLSIVRGVDDLVALHAAIKVTQDSYISLELTPPEWMAERLQAIGNEVKERSEAQTRATLAKLLARREALKSAQEKRTNVEAQIAALRAQLGEVE
jgi:hypothetical protein